MKNKKSITILMVAFTLASCQSYKRVPYLQSYESLTDKGYKEIVINEVNQQDTLYDARIQPKDLLSITVNTSDPQAAAPFNLTMQTSINVAQANSTYYGEPDGGAVADTGIFSFGLVWSDIKNVILLQIIIRRMKDILLI